VVAVGGNEEMLVAVGVWSPSPSPAAGSPAVGLLLVVTVQVRVRFVGRVPAVGRSILSRPPSLSVVEEALRGRLETADGVGGRYDVGSGGLELCGSWVVAVGGNEEMLVTVGGGSPSTSPAIAGSPAVGLLLVVSVQVQVRFVGRVPAVGRSILSRPCAHRWLRRPSAAVSKPPMVWVVGTTSAAAGTGLAVVGGCRGRSRGDAGHGRRGVTVHIARRRRLARRRAAPGGVGPGPGPVRRSSSRCRSVDLVETTVSLGG
jgi:hypothetical protein